MLVFAFAAVGAVTAASVSADAPAEAQVGEEITVSATVSDVYETSEQWRLNGTTELRNVTGWEVTKVTPSGDENTTRFDGSTSFEVSIAGEENLDHVEVSITGTVPPVEQFSYDPPQSFVGADFTRIQGDNVNSIETVSIHHFTEESSQTRTLIDEANEAVEDADSQDARSTLESAIGVFDGSGENFGEARDLAEDAKSTAESAQQSAQTTQLVLYGVGALVVLALLGGGIYYWRSQQDDYDKLR
ncbi:putative membrane protein [Halorhabdus sp. SVX81]|nr:putative membrane protein [Halorhabdus sp. SVX81]WEL20387.1 putative membrane protein [Halorhabdus sp. BNX81]